MSIERLARVLRGVGFEIEPLDVAEIIWLARYLPAREDDLAEAHEGAPTKLPASGNSLNPKDRIAAKVGDSSAAGKDVPKNRIDDKVRDSNVVGENNLKNNQLLHKTFEPESEEKGAQTEIKEVSATADLYLPSKSVEQAGGLAFRSAGTAALPGKLAYSRALRPLLRGVPSQNQFTLDEEATVHRIADTQAWLPVMRPALTRWLELDMVIDEWPSIALWRDSIRELITMLTDLGAFRSVQIWSLWTDPKSGSVELHHGWGANAKEAAPRPIGELNSIRGNRLVLVLSDCISPSWYDGTVGKILNQWGHTEIVVLMQLLPDKFWQRTGLVNATPVLFRSSAPGKSNTQLDAIPAPDSHKALPSKMVFPLPVLPFDPQLVSMWAQSISGKNNLWIPGVLLPLDKSEGLSRQQMIKKEQDQASSVMPSAEDVETKALNLVKRYRQNASPDAWKLAGYLSATSPLNLRVIQLIQRVMLSEVKLEHIAEFYLSGLIKRQKKEGITDDTTYFEFVPGVRSILQSSIKRSELVAVLQHTTQFINKETGKPIDLESSVAAPSLASKPDLDESPFAQVLPSMLRRLGGEYARLADSLEGKTVFEEIVVAEQAEAELKAKEEAERLAAQKAEERIAKAKSVKLDKEKITGARSTTETDKEYERSVFISYAWGGEREEVVNQIDKSLQARGIKLIRDKRNLGYRGSITEFMERIGQGNCVIVVISDKYLRSPNCMFELVEIADGKQFHDRIFPIVLADADIYDPVKRLGYVKHWEAKRAELAAAMKDVDPANLQGVREDMDLYDLIRDKVSGLTSILQDMNTLTPNMHGDSDFSYLYDAIENRLKNSLTKAFSSAKPSEVKAETERKVKEESDRLAAQKAAEERLAKQKAEEEKLAKARAEAERKAKTDANRQTFISYSRKNRDFAIRLARELRTAGFRVWLDQLDIPTGARWDDEVEKALEKCEIFIIILTPASIESGNVKDEIGYAIDAGKRFLPILLEPCNIPLRLRRFQYVDFTNKSFNEGVVSTKELLSSLIDQPTIPREKPSNRQQTRAEEARLAKQKASRISGNKYALIIANTEYTDPGLAQLTTPGKDAKEFWRVLNSPDICAFTDVMLALNETSATSMEKIDQFFEGKKPDDLLLLYFSGHSVRDEYGSLYLAVKNTNRARLRSTAIKSDFIREVMDQSRSRRQVLILDCSNSGAFSQGTRAATGGSVGTATAFEGTGYGRVVLTASDSTQFAWEGDKIIGSTENSLFTHFLVKGLEGEADTNGDGRITIDELYDYAYEQIVSITPKQMPGKWSYRQQGEIVLRQNIRIEDTKLIPLPADLLEEIEDPRPYVREAAVQQLIKILNGKNLGLARSAREALEKIALDENTTRRVAQAATNALGAVPQATDKASQKASRDQTNAARFEAEQEKLLREKAELEKRLEEERIAREKAETQQKAKAASASPGRIRSFFNNLLNRNPKEETNSSNQLNRNPQKETNFGQIFISYSRKDISFVRKLAGDLEKAGYDIWWDLTDLRGGSDWVRVIPAAIESSKFVIVVLTPDSIESEWVRKEYTQALSLRKKLIPIILTTTSVPFALNTIDYVNFTSGKYADSFKSLLTAMGHSS